MCFSAFVLFVADRLFIILRNTNYYCFVRRLANKDSVVIGIWNQKKINKSQTNSGLLGFICLSSGFIQRIKGTGGKCSLII